MKRLGKRLGKRLSNQLGKRCSVAIVTLMIACGSDSILAQQGGDPGGLPTIDPGVQQPAQQPTQTPTTSDPGLQGDFQSSGGDDFQLEGLDLFSDFLTPEFQEIENTRSQPFVGRSLQRFEELGIQAHPRSNALAPGEVFSSGGGGGRGGFTFGGGGGANNRQQGLQRGGTSNNIIRRSLRTRLVPKIEVRNPVTPRQVSTRFQQRISANPDLSDGGSGVQIRVENKTAFLTGVVGSQEERDRVERMARLEPGIYRIDNKIQVKP